MRDFCTAKAPHIFFRQNISNLNFMCAIRQKESLNNGFNYAYLARIVNNDHSVFCTVGYLQNVLFSYNFENAYIHE